MALELEGKGGKGKMVTGEAEVVKAKVEDRTEYPFRHLDVLVSSLFLESDSWWPILDTTFLGFLLCSSSACRAPAIVAASRCTTRNGQAN